MTVQELSREQLTELKEHYLVELDNCGELEEVAGIDTISYGVLADIDEIVPDEVVFNHYDGIDFVEDDFFCTAGCYKEV